MLFLIGVGAVSYSQLFDTGKPEPPSGNGIHSAIEKEESPRRRTRLEIVKDFLRKTDRLTGSSDFTATGTEEPRWNPPLGISEAVGDSFLVEEWFFTIKAPAAGWIWSEVLPPPRDGYRQIVCSNEDDTSAFRVLCMPGDTLLLTDHYAVYESTGGGEVTSVAGTAHGVDVYRGPSDLNFPFPAVVLRGQGQTEDGESVVFESHQLTIPTWGIVQISYISKNGDFETRDLFRGVVNSFDLDKGSVARMLQDSSSLKSSESSED